MVCVKEFLISFVFLKITSGFLIYGKNKSEYNSKEVRELEKRIWNKGLTTYLKTNVSLVSDRDPKPPSHFDWRDKGHVSPVKNQQECAACWAFSTVAAIESHISIYQNTKQMLSEQFLIDCVQAGKDDAPGCGHYSLIKAYSDIVTEFGGVLLLKDYRQYTAEVGTCTYVKPPPTPLPVAGFARVPSNEKTMVEYLYQHGPLSAAINSASMAKYKNNNYIDEPTDDQCSPSPDHMDHAVLIVGYNIYVGKGRKVPYWIIKNSWGENWGDKGFYYLVRGRNACGIANDVSFPILP